MNNNILNIHLKDIIIQKIFINDDFLVGLQINIVDTIQNKSILEIYFFDNTENYLNKNLLNSMPNLDLNLSFIFNIELISIHNIKTPPNLIPSIGFFLASEKKLIIFLKLFNF